MDKESYEEHVKRLMNMTNEEALKILDQLEIIVPRKTGKNLIASPRMWAIRKAHEALREKVEKEERKKPYRWLNRSTKTSHNEECGKCHFLFDNIPQHFPYCPMCGEHLLPIYKRKDR